MIWENRIYIYIFIHTRRKFRSQTSDNMDSRGGNSQKRERVRIERVGKRVSAKADVCGFFTWQEPQWPWWTAEFMWVCLKSNRKLANFPCNCGVYLNSINAVYPNFPIFPSSWNCNFRVYRQASWHSYGIHGFDVREWSTFMVELFFVCLLEGHYNPQKE